MTTKQILGIVLLLSWFTVLGFYMYLDKNNLFISILDCVCYWITGAWVGTKSAHLIYDED